MEKPPPDLPVEETSAEKIQREEWEAMQETVSHKLTSKIGENDISPPLSENIVQTHESPKPGGTFKDFYKPIVDFDTRKRAFEIVTELNRAGENPPSQVPLEAVGLLEKYGISKNEISLLSPADFWKKFKETVQHGQQPESPRASEKDAFGMMREKMGIGLETVLRKTFDVLPNIDRNRLFVGIGKLGFDLQEKKANIFSSLYTKLAEARWQSGKQEEEQDAFVRFYSALKNSYTEASQQARKNKNDLETNSSKLKTVAGIGTLVGNLSLYGRTAIDILGSWTVNPLRYVTMVAMAAGKLGEGMKEARMKGVKQIEKARVGIQESLLVAEELATDAEIAEARKEDIKEAAEEAWKLYETAGGKAGTVVEENGEIQIRGGKEISKEALKQACQENLPQDLLERLSYTKNVYTDLTQNLIEIHLRDQIKKIDTALSDAEQIQNLEERSRKKELIFKAHAAFLIDADRLIARSGAIDQLAYGSRLLEKGGKTLAVAMALETLGEGVHRLWNLKSDLFELLNHVRLSFGVTGKPTSESVEELAKTIPQTTGSLLPSDKPAELQNVFEQYRASAEDFVAAKIGKGEGVEHTFIRQIQLHPNEFGYKGDPLNTAAVKQFANTEAHSLAKKFGYVKAGTDSMTETRVRDVGVSYLLVPDKAGHVSLEKIGLKEDGSSEYLYTKNLHVKTPETPIYYEEDTLEPEALGETPPGSPILSEPHDTDMPQRETITPIEIARHLANETGLPESVFSGFEDKLANLQENELEALRLIITGQEFPFEKWNGISQNDFLERTIDNLLSNNPRDREAFVQEFSRMREKNVGEGNYYNPKEDKALQKIINLLYTEDGTGKKLLELSHLPPEPPENKALAEPTQKIPNDARHAIQKERLLQAGVSEKDMHMLKPEDIMSLSEEQISHVVRETSKNLRTQKSEFALTDTPLHYENVKLNLELLKKSGISADAVQSLDTAAAAKLKPEHIKSLEIAWQDLGIAHFNAEAQKNFLQHSADIFGSYNKRKSFDWIELYKSSMEKNLQSPPPDFHLTQEAVDQHTMELEKLLLGEKVTEKTITQEQQELLQKAIGDVKQKLAEYDANVEKTRSVLEEHFVPKKGFWGKTKEFFSPLSENEKLAEKTEAGIPGAFKEHEQILLIGRKGYEEVIRDPLHYAYFDREGKSILFAGTYETGVKSGETGKIFMTVDNLKTKATDGYSESPKSSNTTTTENEEPDWVKKAKGAHYDAPPDWIKKYPEGKR